ncbi:ATP-dependent RNA helicase RhlB [hydrothermal vent metagenome]|uniref:ATP-dependent RNA helicase RhlB n=1 Tax=hydrothermal vent metagenome TaxID=652676 RepID=A0A3B1CW69_9ZZZZ
MITKIFNLLKKTFITRKEIPPKKEEAISKKTPSRDSSQKESKQKQPANVESNGRTSKQKKHWTPKDFPVEKEEGKVRFYDLHLSNGILHAVADLNYKYCTPIQSGILKHTLEGKDAIGRAQTGTGKTAAFLLTAISRLIRRNPNLKRSKGSPRVLVMAPTRELVIQIEKDAVQLAKYQNLRIVSIYGGMDYKKQINQVKGKYVDIMIATPGRLLDFMKQKLIRLDKVEILILDEADRMLDMGFMPDIRKIERSTPRKENRQTLFFSATFPDSIKRIAEQWTKNAATVEIESEQLEADTITQIIYIVSADEKFKLLFNLMEQKNFSKVLLFCNRKDIAKDLHERLNRRGVSTTLLTGDIDQKKRLRRLENFKKGDIRVLVATDVAGRGIHIENVSHVINYNLSEDPEDYVHRIGRTGRAGLSGTSISFACEDDSFQIPKIEEFLKHKLELIYPEDELLKELPPAPKKPKQEKEHNPYKKRGYKPNNRSNNKRK